MGKGCWLAFDFSVYCVIWRLASFEWALVSACDGYLYNISWDGCGCLKTNMGMRIDSISKITPPQNSI
jgi:hypothetical protein